MAFSGIDKALIERAARILEAEAKTLEKCETVDGSWGKARNAKRTFDALLRDARDLRALAKRLGITPAKRKTAAAKDADRMASGFGEALDLTRGAVGNG